MNTSYSPAKWPRFTLAGFAFFLINTFVVPIAANAQCGYIEGLGCPGTNYSNYGSASNHDAASIEYDNFISAFHTSILRDPEGGFRIWERIPPLTESPYYGFLHPLMLFISPH